MHCLRKRDMITMTSFKIGITKIKKYEIFFTRHHYTNRQYYYLVQPKGLIIEKLTDEGAAMNARRPHLYTYYSCSSSASVAAVICQWRQRIVTVLFPKNTGQKKKVARGCSR